MNAEGRLLDEGLATMAVDLPAPARQGLLAFAALLARWNATFNLTAVRDLPGIVRLHLLDSLSLLPFLGDGPLLDVGSGAGLPGIPVAIARPQLPVVLADSNSKKTAFQRQAVIELGLGNVSVLGGRVEAAGPAEFPQIVSRAFAELATFVALTRHRLATGGRWLAMKGTVPEAEIARLPADVRVVALHRLRVPGVDGERHLVIMEATGG